MLGECLPQQECRLTSNVAGISEVGTSIIVEKSSLGFVAQSCIRGSWGSPCKNCWKCFRKIILDAAIQNENVDEDLISNIFRNHESFAVREWYSNQA